MVIYDFMFQFLIGSLVTKLYLFNFVLSIVFQFLIGSLVTHAVELYMQRLEGFNSS
mgnify:CR=1 FL=1